MSISGATRTVLLSSCASSITPFFVSYFGFGFLTSWQFVQLLRGLIHCHLRFRIFHCFGNEFRQIHQNLKTRRIVSTVCSMVHVLLVAAFVDAASSRLVRANFCEHEQCFSSLGCMRFLPAVSAKGTLRLVAMELLTSSVLSFFVLYTAWRIPCELPLFLLVFLMTVSNASSFEAIQ